MVAAAMTASVLTGPAHAQGTAVADATPELKQTASTAYKRGRAAYDEGRHDDALAAFKESYATVASPNAHLMIAMTLVSMGKKGEGYDELGKVAVEADAAAAIDKKYQKTADNARSTQIELEGEIGKLTIIGAAQAGPPGSVLVVNGRTIEPADWSSPVSVDAGSVTVVLTGNDPITVDVMPGGSATADFSAALAPAGDSPDVETGSGGYDGPDRMLITYIAGGVGAAGLISFGIFGGLAQGKFNSLDDACPNRLDCPIELESDANTGKTFQTVGNVSLALGIVGVAVAAGFLTWELVDPAEDGDEGVDEARFRPRLSVGPGAVTLSGSF
jgi:hypothetical protein